MLSINHDYYKNTAGSGKAIQAGEYYIELTLSLCLRTTSTRGMFQSPRNPWCVLPYSLIINQLLVSPVLCGGTERPDIVHIAKTYLWDRPDSKLCLLPAQTAPIMDPNAVMVR